MADPFICEVSRIRDEAFQRINSYGKKSCQEMEKLWYKIFGSNKEVVIERYQTIEKHITELFEEMLEEEKENYRDRKEELSGLVETSNELRSELSIKIDLPFEIDLDGCNLRKQIKELKNYLQKYIKVREERLQTLQQYKLEEEQLCEKLGEEPMYGSFNEVPSEGKLKEVKTRLSVLKSEILKRTKTFNSLVYEVEELVRDLEIADDLEYEQQAIFAKTDDVILSMQTLKKIEDFKGFLLDQRDAQEKLICSLKDQTMLLWNRLDVSPEEREHVIVRTYKTCGKTVLDIWTKELERCEKLKKANMKTIILRLREEITNLWNECHIDEQQRRFFRDFDSDDFNEELLESHEKEEMHLRKYYEETKDLYTLAGKWFNLWNKMISLESRSNNSERLNNRGGQLLKEERERKAVQKELPKVESKLEKRITDFEKTHDKPFLYDGLPLMELIAEYWENRRAEKENEKEVRKTQIQTRVTPMGKSMSRTVAPSPMSSNRKRGRPMTPMENVTTSIKSTAKRQLKMPTTKNDVPTQRRRSRSHDPAGRYEPKVLRSASANSSVVSYAGFQTYLENKSKTTTSGMPLRSSLSPSRSGTGPVTRNNSILFKTPTSAVKSATKRTRLNNFGASKILRPMIN